ncbi:hypothetical protein DFH09DRAFT_1104508 [Mycena vulgaris]|nr:hypothetical protein DFH09DRAFT_1104508 [Mycena vulgaris]
MYGLDHSGTQLETEFFAYDLLRDGPQLRRIRLHTSGRSNSRGWGETRGIGAVWRQILLASVESAKYAAALVALPLPKPQWVVLSFTLSIAVYTLQVANHARVLVVVGALVVMSGAMFLIFWRASRLSGDDRNDVLGASGLTRDG